MRSGVSDTAATQCAAGLNECSAFMSLAVGQARARRFYAREGFIAVGEPFEFGVGVPALEYRRSLEPS
jgi:predicted GNAT family N-acyltransferase